VQGQPYGQQPYYPPQGAYPPGAYQPPKKSNKGLWIGLGAAAVIIAVACALVFGVFKDKIFGDDGGSQAGTEDRLLAAWDATQSMTASEGTYNIEISLESDTASMSEEEQQMLGAFLSEPITISGDFAFTQDPAAIELSAAAGLFGMNMDLGLMMVDGTPYISVSDQWYEAPPELTEQMSLSDLSASSAQMQQLLTDLSIEPTSWIKGLEEVGEETVNGTKAVHLTGSPDVAKMMADVVKLMESEEGQALMGGLGAATGGSAIDMELPTPEELADTTAQIEELFKDAAIDLWLAKDDDRICRLKIDVQIAPSADAAADPDSPLAGLSQLGLSSIGIAATVDFTGDKVSIKAPDSPLPADELQSAIESEMGMLGSLLGGGF
jgi:hypothetical protein